MASPRGRKAVVVTFGGGARDEETFMPEGQENIPHLLTELIPRATFFSQVVNRGILGHYVATASLATGVYETFNNFAAVPPDHPTVFEYFRRDLKRPASDAWVVAPSNGFNRIGESGHRSYGRGSGAGVILPKRLVGGGSVLEQRGNSTNIFCATITKRRCMLRNWAATRSSCTRWRKFCGSRSPILPRTRALWRARTSSPSISRGI